jgi:mRNA interferase RelE/StbE
LGWTVEISDVALKAIGRLDRQVQKRLFAFLENKITGIDDARKLGKALRGEKVGLWRYRVGDYRLICALEDTRLVVLVVQVGHRRDVYRQ